MNFRAASETLFYAHTLSGYKILFFLALWFLFKDECEIICIFSKSQRLPAEAYSEMFEEILPSRGF